MRSEEKKSWFLKLLFCFHLLYEVSSNNAAIRLSILPVDDDSGVYVGSKGFLLLSEGQPLNLTCAVQVADSKTKIFRNFDDTSDTTVPHYEINWYLPDLQPEDKYHITDGFNQHTLYIKETRYSGVYKCTATNRRMSEKYPPSLVKEVTVRVKPNSDGRIPTCGKHFFQCFSNAHHCIARRYTCDGVPDCFDGSDEGIEECGVGDPCAAKLRCEDHRCMDPSQCCDPDLDPSCTVLQDCCVALIESGRQFYKLGVERRNNQDLKFLHSTIYTVSGCVVAFLILLLLVTMAVCRLHAKRGWSWRYGLGQGGARGENPRGGGRAHPPITLHDLDVYFASLRRVDSRHSLAGAGHGITYNINNGVQIVGAPSLPPPYSVTVNGDPRHVVYDPPPPYNAAVANPPAQDQDPDAEPLLMENNNEENNNNGDINGNSDMVDHNLAHQRQQQQQQQQQHHQQQHHVHSVASLDIHPVPVAAAEGGGLHHLRGATGPVNGAMPYQGVSSVRASPVLWSTRQGGLPSQSSGSLSAVHQAALSPSRLLYPADDSSSSSDSD